MASSRTITTLTIIGVVFVSIMMIAMSAIIIDNRVQITVLAAQVTRLENKVLQWQFALRDVQNSARDCCRKIETKPPIHMPNPTKPLTKPETLPSKECTCKNCNCKKCNCTKEKCKCSAPSS